MFGYRVCVLSLVLFALSGCGERAVVAGSTCAVDKVNDSTELVMPVKSNAVLNVAGWAIDGVSKQAPESITLNLVAADGKAVKFADGELTVARPDVSGKFEAPSIAKAGFGVSAQVGSFSPGTYEIQIMQNFSDRIIVCGTTKKIRIE